MNLQRRGRGLLISPRRGRGARIPRVTMPVKTQPKYSIDEPEFRVPLVPVGPTLSSSRSSARRQRTPRGRGTSSSSVGPSAKFSRNISSNKSKITPSPSTSATTNDSSAILAIISGRGDAKWEVGLAAIDLHFPHLILCQISDNQVYSNTTVKVNFFRPIEVIMPESMVGEEENPQTKIYHAIRKKFKNILIKSISRMFFNDVEGMDNIRNLCAQDFVPVLEIVKEKYYALAATNALLKYVGYIQQMTYNPKSLRIDYQALEGSAMIDIEAAEILELTVSLNPAMPKFNLLDALDRCNTPAGKKLLRTSILQPPCDAEFIEKRQTCVSELVSNQALCTILQPVVRQFHGANKLLSLSMNYHNANIVAVAERNLNYILLLKSTLEVIPQMRSTLETAISPFFKKVQQNLSDPRFNTVMELISQIIQSDAKALRGYTSATMQRCFAIKARVNDLLDIARQAYCESIDNMMKLVSNYSEKYGMDLTLSCTAVMGYHIQMSLPRGHNFDPSRLPKEFLNPKKKGNSAVMTTEDLVVLSQRSKEACEEVHIMSNVLLEELLNRIRDHISCLFQMCADIAELDLVMSLARVSTIPGFVEPTFSHKLHVTESVHPILYIQGRESPTPNDIEASVPYNFKIITGPNMSGKTTYLKQVILLHVVAQIGCYVPATRAEFRICDRFFCLMTSRAEVEGEESSFVIEMKRAKYAMQSLTRRSLVVLDEPCKSTGAEEGTAMAIGICTRIQDSLAFGFCATHYISLSQLADLYPNVTNHNFECLPRLFDDLTLTYTHKLKPGVTTIVNYGIAIAALSNFPLSVINDAKIMADKLLKEKKALEPNEQMEDVKERNRIHAFLAKIYDLVITNRYTEENVLWVMESMGGKEQWGTIVWDLPAEGGGTPSSYFGDQEFDSSARCREIRAITHTSDANSSSCISRPTRSDKRPLLMSPTLRAATPIPTKIPRTLQLPDSVIGMPVPMQLPQGTWRTTKPNLRALGAPKSSPPERSVSQPVMMASPAGQRVPISQPHLGGASQEFQRSPYVPPPLVPASPSPKSTISNRSSVHSSLFQPTSSVPSTPQNRNRLGFISKANQSTPKQTTTKEPAVQPLRENRSLSNLSNKSEYRKANKEPPKVSPFFGAHGRMPSPPLKFERKLLTKMPSMFSVHSTDTTHLSQLSSATTIDADMPMVDTVIQRFTPEPKDASCSDESSLNYDYTMSIDDETNQEEYYISDDENCKPLDKDMEVFKAIEGPAFSEKMFYESLSRRNASPVLMIHDEMEADARQSMDDRSQSRKQVADDDFDEDALYQGLLELNMSLTRSIRSDSGSVDSKMGLEIYRDDSSPKTRRNFR